MGRKDCSQVKRTVCQSSIQQVMLNQMVNVTFPDIFNISGTALMCVRQTKSRYSQEFSIGGGRLSWLKTVKCKNLDSNQ